MSRKIVFSKDEYYHVFNRGVEKRTVFKDEYDKLRFQKLLYVCNGDKNVHISVLKDEIKGNGIYRVDRGKPSVAIGAYCLMGNHFHLLLKEDRSGGISQFMHKLSTAYTMYFNIKNHRTGSLFEGNFKARHASYDEYLKYLFSYIHLNPVQHVDPEWKSKGISNLKNAWKYVSTYRFSSLIDYLGKARSETTILAASKFPSYFDTRATYDEVREWLLFKPESFDDASFQG